MAGEGVKVKGRFYIANIRFPNRVLHILAMGG